MDGRGVIRDAVRFFALLGIISVPVAAQFHSADTDEDQQITLSELLRVIQFYNSAGLHCLSDTEDGFAPGQDPEHQTCASHDSDYNPQDWRINLSELLRLIQFYNCIGYYVTVGTEDGFLPEATTSEGEDEVVIIDPPFDTMVLFDNHNDMTAAAVPSSSTEFVLEEAALVAEVYTWHVPGAKNLSRAGTISIETPEGTVLGPWPAVAISYAPGMAVLWRATPNTPLVAGSYTLLDSEPETWFQNTASGNAGFAQLLGRWFDTIGSETIGPEGGEFVGSGLRVIIPPGSFPEPATLTASRMDPHEEDALSPRYLLDGFPPEYGAVSMEIDLSGEHGESEDVQMRLAMEGYQYSTGRIEFNPEPVPATFENGKVQFELPDAEPITDKQMQGQKQQKPGRVEVEPGTLAYGYSTAHFRIQCTPREYANYQSHIERLGATLEEAYTRLTTEVGLPFLKRTRWPIDITLHWFWFDTACGYAYRSKYGRNRDFIEFNFYIVRDSTQQTLVKAVAIHELFHILQYNYVIPETGAAGECDWLMDASSTWSEWLMAGAKHYPSVVVENEGRLPLNGLLAASRTACIDGEQKPNSDYHGYTGSIFLRHLFDPFGSQTANMGVLWNSLGTGSGATNAFHLASGGSWLTEWQIFCRKLYGGELIDWFLSQEIQEHKRQLSTQSISRQVEITRGQIFDLNADSQLRKFHLATGPLPPVSANLFQIKVNYMPAKPEDRFFSIFPEALSSDTGFQVRWYKPKVRIYPDDLIAPSFVAPLGEPVFIDLNNITGLAIPFVLQMIITNKDTINAYPASGVRWAFGPAIRLEDLQKSKNIRVNMVYKHSNNQTLMAFPPGSPPFPPNLDWNASSFEYHLEWTENGGTLVIDHKVDITGSVDSNAEWLEYANCTYTITTVGNEFVGTNDLSLILGPIRLSECDMVPAPGGSQGATYQAPDVTCVQILRNYSSSTNHGVFHEELLTKDDVELISVTVGFR